MHKKDQGKMGEALVAHLALKKGYAVFVEFGDNSKIDMIIEGRDKKLHRVQVKVVSRNLKDENATTLYLYKSGPNYRYKYTSDDVDWFAVVDIVTDKVAWIPSTVCNSGTSSGFTLRHAPTKSGQMKKTRMFDDYVECPFM